MTVKMGETIRSEYSVNDTPDHSIDTTGGSETKKDLQDEKRKAAWGKLKETR